MSWPRRARAAKRALVVAALILAAADVATAQPQPPQSVQAAPVQAPAQLTPPVLAPPQDQKQTPQQAGGEGAGAQPRRDVAPSRTVDGLIVEGLPKAYDARPGHGARCMRRASPEGGRIFCY